LISLLVCGEGDSRLSVQRKWPKTKNESSATYIFRIAIGDGEIAKTAEFIFGVFSAA
jgi:hypothetical protein